MGAIACPLCGSRGHLRYNLEVNLKTGNYRAYALVAHHKSVRQGVKVKKIHLGTCYIGPVKAKKGND